MGVGRSAPCGRPCVVIGGKLFSSIHCNVCHYVISLNQSLWTFLRIVSLANPICRPNLPLVRVTIASPYSLTATRRMVRH